MSTQWSGATNMDGSKNISVKVGEAPLTGHGYVTGYKDNEPSLTKPDGANYRAIGGGLNLDCPKGLCGVGVSGQNIPSFGNQATASAKLNVLQTEDHRVDVTAHTTRNFPKHPAISSFGTHGGSVDYQFRDKAGASLGVANTPMFQQKDYSASGSINLHRTPNSSLDFNIGANKTISPSTNTGWQPGAWLGFKKSF